MKLQDDCSLCERIQAAFQKHRQERLNFLYSSRWGGVDEAARELGDASEAHEGKPHQGPPALPPRTWKGDKNNQYG